MNSKESKNTSHTIVEISSSSENEFLHDGIDHHSDYQNFQTNRKNVTTIRSSTKKEILLFQEQERERFNNPTKAYQYIYRSRKIWVGPAVKKVSNWGAKPRKHALLSPHRPYFVTILCLVRDAVARLPNAKGTRMDVCRLLSESQFIDRGFGVDKLSMVVSRAMDRLHYE